ncbi:MAG: type II toxin-antitoxin system VapC family toxin [Proteobacteria bacterium]|nr:type II toxin-antitoxin system VapC family toxin [Pseudomonadota bacterium]
MSEVDTHYLDTSALLPYYRDEPASLKVQDIIMRIKPPVAISDLSKVEFASALARWVRMDELTEAQVNLIENMFKKDIGVGFFLRHPLSTSHFRQAEKWLSGRKTALRTLDALHLACCWTLDAELITCDTTLHDSANTLGVKTRFISPS